MLALLIVCSAEFACQPTKGIVSAGRWTSSFIEIRAARESVLGSRCISMQKANCEATSTDERMVD